MSFTTVGENILAVGNPQQVNYTAYVESWFNTRATYDYDTNTCGTITSCDQYTQVQTYVHHTILRMGVHGMQPDLSC